MLFFINSAFDWGVSALQDNNLDSSWIKYIYPFTPKSDQICQTSSSSYNFMYRTAIAHVPLAPVLQYFLLRSVYIL